MTWFHLIRQFVWLMKKSSQHVANYGILCGSLLNVFNEQVTWGKLPTAPRA
jgi:hypothetical protein